MKILIVILIDKIGIKEVEMIKIRIETEIEIGIETEIVIVIGIEIVIVIEIEIQDMKNHLMIIEIKKLKKDLKNDNK